MRFANKVAIVTGAAQGIGEAYAKALGAEGASVVVADLNVESGERVAKEIETAGGSRDVRPLRRGRRGIGDRDGRRHRRPRTAASTCWSTTPPSTATWSSTC